MGQARVHAEIQAAMRAHKADVELQRRAFRCGPEIAMSHNNLRNYGVSSGIEFTFCPRSEDGAPTCRGRASATDYLSVCLVQQYEC